MGVSTALLQKRWNDNQLYMESLLPDPLFNSADLTKVVDVGPGRNKIAMPESEFFLDVTPKDKKGKAARTVELVFLKSLDMDPIEGNASELIGSEETLALKSSAFTANDWCGGVTEDTFGIDFRELSAYGVYSEIRPLLSQWLGELRGYYARYALVHKHSPNLEAAPISTTSGTINPNVYFMGLTESRQPAYDSTTADFISNIGNAHMSANGTGCIYNVPKLLKLIDWARDTKYIEPGKINGNAMYLLLSSTDDFRNLRDPSVDDSWGRYWRDVAATEDLNKVVPGGTKMVIAEELVVVRDPRSPTMAISGTTSNYTLSFGYMKYGRKTTRITTRGTAGTYLYYNVNFLLGRGALVKYEPELPHFETQGDNHGKYKSTGLFGAVGYKVPVWDVDSPTDSTAQQESSAIILTSRL
jgi:hypothetical protein